MQTFRLFLAVVAVVLFGVLALSAARVTRGVGWFKQVVVVDTGKPIRWVGYSRVAFDPEALLACEKAADLPTFECVRTATAEGGNRFSADLLFATHDSRLRHTVFPPERLTIIVDFADGTRSCRVVDLPPGLGVDEVVLRLP